MDFKKQLDELKIKLERYEEPANFDECKAHADYFGECMSIETLEAILDHYKAKRDAILEKEIPLLLGCMGLKTAEFDDGSKIAIQSLVSVAQKDKAKLFDWLESVGYADAIKETLAFGKGQIDEDLLFNLKNQGYEFSRDSKVEAMTLKKIVSDQLKETGSLPPETACTVRVFERAKLTK